MSCATLQLNRSFENCECRYKHLSSILNTWVFLWLWALNSYIRIPELPYWVSLPCTWQASELQANSDTNKFTSTTAIHIHGGWIPTVSNFSLLSQQAAPELSYKAKGGFWIIISSWLHNYRGRWERWRLHSLLGHRY